MAELPADVTAHPIQWEPLPDGGWAYNTDEWTVTVRHLGPRRPWVITWTDSDEGTMRWPCTGQPTALAAASRLTQAAILATGLTARGMVTRVEPSSSAQGGPRTPLEAALAAPATPLGHSTCTGVHVVHRNSKRIWIECDDKPIASSPFQILVDPGRWVTGEMARHHETVPLDHEGHDRRDEDVVPMTPDPDWRGGGRAEDWPPSRCLAHGELEPCGTCRAYIAGGL